MTPDTTITLENYLNGRALAFPLTGTMLACARDLIARIQALEVDYGNPLTITSGYRPRAISAVVPGAKIGDAHETCEGVDLRDRDGKLSKWCLEHVEKLIELGLYMESPSSAKDHVHLQTRAPRSGHRVFLA